MGQSLPEFAKASRPLSRIGFGSLALTLDRRHAQMLAAEAMWKGYQAVVVEVDVPQLEEYRLPERLMGLGGEQLTPEYPLLAAMVAHQFPVKVTDRAGAEVSHPSRLGWLGNSAVDFPQHRSSRSEMFKGHGSWSPL